MPALTRTAFPVQEYSPGVSVSRDFSLPLGLVNIRLKLPVISWPATNERVGRVRLELSFDGGQTWRSGGEATFCGIPATGPDGNPCTECTLDAIGIKQPLNPDRRARVRLGLLTTLQTGVELEATEVRLGNV